MHDPTEGAIDDFLEGDPRAKDLAEMVSALEMRRANFLRERAAASTEAGRKECDARLKDVNNQIRVLREEQAITGFVEDSIRATVYRNLPDIDLTDLE